MKTSILVLALGLVAASAANASQIRCAEKGEAATKAHRLQYAVFLTTGERITDPRVVGKHDFAEYVKVNVLSRDPREEGAKFTRDRAAFTAVAKSEDVMYDINARRSNGFEMGIYMDELDQTWVKLEGVHGTLRMNCSIKE